MRIRSKKLKKEYLEDPDRCSNCGVICSDKKCMNCKKARMIRIKKKRDERIANGLCSVCGDFTNRGNKRCDNCLQKQRDFRLNKKLQVFKEYGNKCNCCGEKTITFLTIDHIDNNGAEHRRELAGDSGKFCGSAIYSWLIKNKYPDGFQILCANCQLGKQLNNGICPHKQ
jgi:hypothetical protein